MTNISSISHVDFLFSRANIAVLSLTMHIPHMVWLVQYLVGQLPPLESTYLSDSLVCNILPGTF